MPRKKKPETLEELYAEQEKAQEELRKAKQKEKILCNQISKLTRNARTHRLCTRGAMLETFLLSAYDHITQAQSRFYTLGNEMICPQFNNRLTKKESTQNRPET